MDETETIAVRVAGRVQGVGYRAWTADEARRRGLRGWVRNLPDGSVAALVSGPGPAVAEMLAAMRIGPPGAAVDRLVAEPAPEDPPQGFAIRR